MRAIVGFEQAGASSANGVQRFFANLYVSSPFPLARNSGKQKDGKDSVFGPRVRVLFDARLTTVPQQITSGISDFATQFPQKVAEIKVNEVAQAADFLAGTEIRLSGFDPGGAHKNRYSLNLLLEGGASTPITPRASLEVFDIGPDTLTKGDRDLLQKRYPQTVGAAYAAFANQDRDRFFRQYYAGFRFKTYYGAESARYPSTLDVLYGQNEAVTGGRLRGGILRIDGFQAMPVSGWAGSVYVFGTFMLKPSRATITDPLLLQPGILCTGPKTPAGCVTVPGSTVATIYSPQYNRDFYRIGLGVDIGTLIRQIGVGKAKAAAEALKVATEAAAEAKAAKEAPGKT